jgi:hypothetical protein
MELVMPDEQNEPERRARGRPRNQTRETTRGGAREDFIGRGGEALTRSRKGGTDPFHVPSEIVPEGWSYQWNAVTIYNNPDLLIGQQMQMYENGWRPVPAERHPGRYVPVNKTGDIIRDGMRLEERPIGMTKQAKNEETAAAMQQMRDRDESLMGSKANVRGAMKNGFEMNSGRYRGTGGSLKMSIDPGVDIPAPSHKTTDE